MKEDGNVSGKLFVAPKGTHIMLLLKLCLCLLLICHLLLSDLLLSLLEMLREIDRPHARIPAHLGILCGLRLCHLIHLSHSIWHHNWHIPTVLLLHQSRASSLLLALHLHLLLLLHCLKIGVVRDYN